MATTVAFRTLDDASLGSGYNRLKPVVPHKPIVPAGALSELRLDARKENVIPL